MSTTNTTNEDVESAYGSETTSNSASSLKKETFSIRESTNKRQKWSELLKDRILGYSIEQCAAGFILLLLLINSCGISSNIKDNNAMISTLQQKVDRLQKTSDTFETPKTESCQMENEMIKETITEALNEAKPLFVSENVVKTVENRDTLTSNQFCQINAASYVMGAEVDTSRSSNSSLNHFFGDESDQVLIDRLEPPAKKAWCSEDKEPVLTFNMKDCKTVYSYNCCTFCPECCEDCPMFDGGLLISFLFFLISLIAAGCFLVFLGNYFKW
uniref:SUN domain-containing protein n=1 Tax=Caenorhabditis tropicalis TaxID=1561998 RepID=A0A1I7THQ1_9PELO